MYTATYRLEKKEMDGNDDERGLKSSLSLDSVVENVNNESIELEKSEAANEYLKHVLGDVLGVVLTDCVLKRPDDPVMFLADAFEK